MNRGIVPTGETQEPGARILVVDDDERNLLALSETLSPLAEVVCASSGRDALRELLGGEFAVILLDVYMPGLDGYETAGLIRERKQTSRIPIIFLSAVNKESAHLMRGYQMGAVDYVFKPVDPVILASKVGVFVDLYKMRRQVEQQAQAERKLRDEHYREQLNRMEIERRLRDSERRQASILRALPLAIYEAEERAGESLTRQFVGGDLAHFLGDEADAVLDGEARWEDWIHPEDRARADQAVARGGDTVTLEYRWIGPDGLQRHLLDQRIRTAGEDGSGHWAGTLLDISERKRLEAQLVHAGKLDSLGQLTGGVAHDFNNLLAAVLGGLNILERRIELGEREQRILDQMRHAAEQGTELVRRMMAFARQQELTPASVHPETLCDAVAGLVNHTLGGTVTVTWKCPDRALNLFVDRSQVELALMNLIINARDAMPEGGEIRVSIEEVESKTVPAPALRIRIQDSGCGMTQDVLAKVTEPFFTTKETGKGTGLGLSMVAGFVHQSGGEIGIDSTPGRGTTIDLVLPATEDTAETMADGEDGGLDWIADKRLALIDDDDAVRIVLSEQLRDAGGIIDEFGSGQEAIAAIGSDPERYDFILSDFAMPELDGLETLRQVKKVAPHVRAVLMTGNADDARLMKNLTVPVVRKPIRLALVAAAFSTQNQRQPEQVRR